MSSKIFVAWTLATAFSWLPTSFGTNAVADMNVVALRCEYLQDPLGIDETQPRLSWRVESDQRGQKQTAYRVWWPRRRIS